MKNKEFSEEDYTRLMQLIGYSISGYGELSTSPKDMIECADRSAYDLHRNKNDQDG